MIVNKNPLLDLKNFIYINLLKIYVFVLNDLKRLIIITERVEYLLE